jgi:Phytanoyl-CoA dioxygenase (PhyH)
MRDPIEEAFGSFRASGYAAFGPIVPAGACREILAAIEGSRLFGPQLFLTKAEFAADPLRFGVNPRPGRNLMEKVAVGSITSHPILHAFLLRMLGDAYSCRMGKVVCSVPASWIPDWVAAEIDASPNTNLGAYVRPAHRDITWFHGIDFHQDIIDYKGETADKITVYVYVSDVTASESPLIILPGSNRFGVTMFPHELERSVPRDEWTYSDTRGHTYTAAHLPLVGPSGSVYAWHACLLHGTQPAASSGPRFSLRFIFEKTPGISAEIDTINANLAGPVVSASTEAYRDEHGVVVVRGNRINDVR